MGFRTQGWVDWPMTDEVMTPDELNVAEKVSAVGAVVLIPKNPPVKIFGLVSK